MKSTFENKEKVFSVREKTAEGWSNECSYSLMLTDEVQATGHVCICIRKVEKSLFL